MTAQTTSPIVLALAWALVHFLWQGAAIGAGFFVWLRLRRPSAQARYAAGVVALAALVAAPVGTCLWLARPPAAAPATAVMEIDAAVTRPDANDLPPSSVAQALPAGVDEPGTARPAETRETAAAAIVTIWAIGVLLLSLRLAGGWILARRLVVRAPADAAPEVLALAAGLASRLGLTRAVRVVESRAVSVPVLVGWLKPVVLLPACALSGLSTGQIEALIAHELAHVRRHDYLVNLLQSSVETLLFYHPAVWLVSREVRDAREHCCDDLAIAVCDRMVYVTALADLAHMHHAPRIALAASGGSLLRRVQRLLGQPGSDRGPGVAWLGVFSLALVFGGVMPSAVDSEVAQVAATAAGVPGGPSGARGGEGATANDASGAVRGGVPGEIAGGVAGGVAGSVPGAIAGGVSPEREGAAASAAGQAVPDRQEQVRQAEEVRRLRQADADFAERRRSEEAQREIEARIVLLERRMAAQTARPEPGGATADSTLRSAAALEARAVLALAEVDAVRSQVESARPLVESGLMVGPSLQALQAQRDRLAAAEREAAAVAVEVQIGVEEEAIDVMRALLRSEARLEEAEAEWRAASQRFEAIVERANVGIADRDAVADAEAMIEAAERRHATAMSEYEITQEETALRQRRLGVMRRLADELRDAGARAVRARDDRRGATAAAIPVTDPAARAAAGDVLSIEIAGEPDLPRTYTVDGAGSVRLPLVGAIEVGGLTASQARDAVAAALARRGLAAGSAVTVVLARPPR